MQAAAFQTPQAPMPGAGAPADAGPRGTNLNLHRFIAQSATDAVTQIRSTLGAEAVVVNVRQLPAQGIARLWQKPRIEVLAYRPEGIAAPSGGDDPGIQLPPSPTADRPGPIRHAQSPTDPISAESGASALSRRTSARLTSGASALTPYVCQPGWRVGAVLESSGLMPVHAQRVVEQLRSQYGEQPPASLAEELALARATLAKFWRRPALVTEELTRLHVLVGAPGVGKTTCLCKWLTQAVLVEGRSARVWRLDGTRANTAEALSVYCEILNVPLERFWSGEERATQGEGCGVTPEPDQSDRSASKAMSDLAFVDLPGIDWREATAMAELAEQLKGLGAPRVHLVLNAAYDTSLLLAQTRAFSALPIKDLIFTHLDEEPRWGKLWNVVLGTNRPVRFFSAGQNIPGDFWVATAERILERQFAA
jgi:flagellar biosynthesis protein FlhF